jgi:hypothetical protein
VPSLTIVVADDAKEAVRQADVRFEEVLDYLESPRRSPDRLEVAVPTVETHGWRLRLLRHW